MWWHHRPLARSWRRARPTPRPVGFFIWPKPLPDVAGHRAGVLIGISGLDRVGLARYLRSKNVEVTIAANATELANGLREGRFELGVTEMLLAQEIAARDGFAVEWAPPELPRYPLVLGLWKGDITLKRAIVDGLDRLARQGDIARIMSRYLKQGKVAQSLGTHAPLGVWVTHPPMTNRASTRSRGASVSVITPVAPMPSSSKLA